jgi:NAD(P)-dependent dehydrogenase (short-subunit alcohol dehydrogenase family)
MAARNKSKAEEAIAKLKQEGLSPGNGQVIWLELDLSDPRNAKAAAQEFMSKEKRLDILSKCSDPTQRQSLIPYTSFSSQRCRV